jgi:hypothetical protein
MPLALFDVIDLNGPPVPADFSGVADSGGQWNITGGSYTGQFSGYGSLGGGTSATLTNSNQYSYTPPPPPWVASSETEIFTVLTFKFPLLSDILSALPPGAVVISASLVITWQNDVDPYIFSGQQTEMLMDKVDTHSTWSETSRAWSTWPAGSDSYADADIYYPGMYFGTFADIPEFEPYTINHPLPDYDVKFADGTGFYLYYGATQSSGTGDGSDSGVAHLSSVSILSVQVAITYAVEAEGIIKVKLPDLTWRFIFTDANPGQVKLPDGTQRTYVTSASAFIMRLKMPDGTWRDVGWSDG